MDRYIEQNSN